MFEKTIKILEKAKGECVGEILDTVGIVDERNDHAWRAINRLIKRLKQNGMKPYSKPITN